MVFFLFMTLHFLIKSILPVIFIEIFMMKVTLRVRLSYFVKVIHIKLILEIRLLVEQKKNNYYV
jgi:hypothetical protein